MSVISWNRHNIAQPAVDVWTMHFNIQHPLHSFRAVDPHWHEFRNAVWPTLEQFYNEVSQRRTHSFKCQPRAIISTLTNQTPHPLSLYSQCVERCLGRVWEGHGTSINFKCQVFSSKSLYGGYRGEKTILSALPGIQIGQICPCLDNIMRLF